jgi:hypothetical protein
LLDGVHTDSLAKREAPSCARFQENRLRIWTATFHGA